MNRNEKITVSRREVLTLLLDNLMVAFSAIWYFALLDILLNTNANIAFYLVLDLNM